MVNFRCHFLRSVRQYMTRPEKYVSAASNVNTYAIHICLPISHNAMSKMTSHKYTSMRSVLSSIRSLRHHLVFTGNFNIIISLVKYPVEVSNTGLEKILHQKVDHRATDIFEVSANDMLNVYTINGSAPRRKRGFRGLEFQ